MDSKKVGFGIGIAAIVILLFSVVLIFISKNETTYNVTFKNDGFTETVEVKENDTVTRPVDPTKEGYTFEGWYYEGTRFDFTTKITKDIVLEARWTSNSVKKWVVTFDSNGGKNVDSLNVEDGKTIIDIPTPTREGYTFVAWYYNNKEFDFDTAITKDITLKAEWKVVEKPVSGNTGNTTIKYTVTFDSDGGSSVKSQTVEKYTIATKPSDPTKEGYTFIGWYNGTYEFNFSTKITKNITLTAKWEKVVEPEEPVVPEEPEEVKSYTVKFDTKGGNTIASQTVKENELVTNPEDPTKSGYTFLGWFIGDTKFDFTTKVTKDITLTAKWEKVVLPEEPVVPEEPEEVKSYTVKFDTKGGNTIASQTIKEGFTVTKPANPTKDKHTFLGWYYDGKEYNFNTKVSKDITLTASWATYDIEETNSDVGQVIIFVYKDTTKVDGYVDITLNNGKIVTNVEISKDGYVTNGYRIKSISNVKVK